MENIVEFIEFERKAKGLTLEYLGKALGLSKSSLSRRLSGALPFSIAEIEAINKELGTNFQIVQVCKRCGNRVHESLNCLNPLCPESADFAVNFVDFADGTNIYRFTRPYGWGDFSPETQAGYFAGLAANEYEVIK